MKMKKKIMFSSMGVVVLVGAAFFLFGGSKKGDDSALPRVKVVKGNIIDKALAVGTSGHADRGWLEFAYLADQPVEVFSGRKSDNRKAVGKAPDAVERAGADGTRAAKQNDVLHLKTGVCGT